MTTIAPTPWRVSYGASIEAANGQYIGDVDMDAATHWDEEEYEEEPK